MARTSKTKDSETVEMTRDSYNELVAELENRKNVIRAEIAKEISEARELGDLSENHAYTIAMEKKEINENRISDLEDIVKNVSIVEKNTSKVVTVGKKVLIVNTKTKKEREVILTGDEKTEGANPEEGKISTNSPIGAAILNSKEGDKVEVKLPMGSAEFLIKKVS